MPATPSPTRPTTGSVTPAAPLIVAAATPETAPAQLQRLLKAPVLVPCECSECALGEGRASLLPEAAERSGIPVGEAPRHAGYNHQS